jgi:hypothetical protein
MDLQKLTMEEIVARLRQLSEEVKTQASRHGGTDQKAA